jgi:hypothetical protein
MSGSVAAVSRVLNCRVTFRDSKGVSIETVRVLLGIVRHPELGRSGEMGAERARRLRPATLLKPCEPLIRAHVGFGDVVRSNLLSKRLR